MSEMLLLNWIGFSVLYEYLIEQGLYIDQLCDKNSVDKEGVFYFVREVKRGEEKIGLGEEIGQKLFDYRNHAPWDSRATMGE